MLHITFKYCPNNKQLVVFMAEYGDYITRYIRDVISGNPFGGVQQDHVGLIFPATYVPALGEHVTLSKPCTVSSQTIDLIIEIDCTDMTAKRFSKTLQQRLCIRFPELSEYTFYIRRVGESADHALHQHHRHYCRQSVT